jgi:uncharacterized protein YndB with AHSA1/START domain
VTENEILIAAPRERVFAVLAEPSSYAEWLVGTKQVRGAEGGWPKPGARMHHSVGAGPVTIDDSTEVLECDEPARLVLLARLGPLGEFKVDLRLEQVEGDATKVTMLEGPVEGISRFAGPAGDAFGYARNALSLRRLKELAEP